VKRIVIVGAGIAGGNAAVGLREAGYEGEVHLLGAEPTPPFGRPPLTKTYLRDEEDLSGWMVKPEDWYASNDVELRADARVERVDPSGGRVVLADGTEIACDRVCIATGCRPRRPTVEGADLENVFVLRTKADADAIKAAAHRSGAKAVVIGMSFIGSEVAASLRQLGVEVTAIFPDAGPLERVLGEVVARRMSAIHTKHGVELLANESLGSFRGGGTVEEVVTESGRAVGCTFAVVGIGVEPNVDVLDGSGVDVDDGVLVDASCCSSVDSVFATGDVANHDHPLFGRLRVEHYNNAEKQGRFVASALLDQPGEYGYVHSFWSDQYDDKLEYVGFAKEWDDFVVRGDLDAHEFVGFYLKDGRVLAAMGLNRGGDPEAEPDSELAAAVGLIRSGKRVDRRRLADEGEAIAS
jgi:3-phenylpropionate/trans-cinnamate dioxygenase ferredoxin reductase component